MIDNKDYEIDNLSPKNDGSDGYTYYTQTHTGESISITDDKLASDRQIVINELHGNTWQDPDNLSNIRSVGELYVDEQGQPILDKDGNEQYKVEVESCGKNLFHEGVACLRNSEEWGYNTGYLKKVSLDGVDGYLAKGSSLDYYSPIVGKETFKFKSATQYSFTINTTQTEATWLNMMCWYDDGTSSRLTGAINTRKTMVSQVGKTVTGFGIAVGEAFVYNVSLEEGVSQDTNLNHIYIPCQSSKTTILLPQPLRKIDTYADRFYWDNDKKHYCIEKKVSSIVPPVSELGTIKKDAFTNNERFTCSFPRSIPYLNAHTNNQTKDLLVSKFKVCSYAEYDNIDYRFGLCKASNEMKMFFNIGTFADSTAFSNWWVQNNITFYTKIDTPQIIDLPHLNTQLILSTYHPTTHIINDTNGVSGNMVVDVPYRKPMEPPTRPNNFKFTRGENGIHSATWDASQNAFGYHVYIGSTKLFTTTETSCTINHELSGYLKVVAYNPLYETESTLILVKTQPNKPTNFNVINSQVGDNMKFTVTFADNSQIEDSYKVKYRIDSSTETVVDFVSETPNTTGNLTKTFDIPLSQIGVYMTLRLCVANNIGEVFADNTVEITTQKPNPPRDFHVDYSFDDTEYIFDVNFYDTSETELGHKIVYKIDGRSEQIIQIPITNTGELVTRRVTVPKSGFTRSVWFKACSYNPAGEVYSDTIYFNKPTNVVMTTVNTQTTITWDEDTSVNQFDIKIDGRKIAQVNTNKAVIERELFGFIEVFPVRNGNELIASDQEYIKTMPNKALYTEASYIQTPIGYDITVGFADNSEMETHYTVEYKVDEGNLQSVDIDTEYMELPSNATLDPNRTDIMWLAINETQGRDIEFHGVHGLDASGFKMSGNTVGGKSLGTDSVITLTNVEQRVPIRFETELTSNGEDMRLVDVARNEKLSMVVNGVEGGVQPHIYNKIGNEKYIATLTYLEGRTDTSTLESTQAYGYTIGRTGNAYDTMYKTRIDYATKEYEVTGREAWAIDGTKTNGTHTTISVATLQGSKTYSTQQTANMISNQFTTYPYSTTSYNHLAAYYTTKLFVTIANNVSGVLSTDNTATKVNKCKQYLTTLGAKFRYELANVESQDIVVDVFKGERFTLNANDTMDITTKKVTLNGVQKDIYLVRETGTESMMDTIPLNRQSTLYVGESIKGRFAVKCSIEPELKKASNLVDDVEILDDGRVKFTKRTLGNQVIHYGNKINGTPQIQIKSNQGLNRINVSDVIKPSLIQGNFPAMKYVSVTFSIGTITNKMDIQVVACNDMGENYTSDKITKYVTPTPIWAYLVDSSETLVQWTDILTVDTQYKVKYRVGDGLFEYVYIDGDNETTGKKIQYRIPLADNEIAELSICAVSNGVEQFYSNTLLMSKENDTSLVYPSGFDYRWIDENRLEFFWNDSYTNEQGFEFVYTIDNGEPVSVDIPSTTMETTDTVYRYAIDLRELQTVKAKVRMKWELNNSAFTPEKIVTNKLQPPTNLAYTIEKDGTLISWKGSSSATSYKLYLDDKLIETTTSVGIFIKYEMKGYLYVVACKDAYESDPSEGIYIKTKPNAPDSFDIAFEEAGAGYKFTVTFIEKSYTDTRYELRYCIDNGDLVVEEVVTGETPLILEDKLITHTFYTMGIQNNITIDLYAINEAGETKVDGTQALFVTQMPRWTYIVEENCILFDWVDNFDFETQYKIQYQINDGSVQFDTISTSGINMGEHVQHKISLNPYDRMSFRIACATENTDHFYTKAITISKALDTTLTTPSDLKYQWIGEGLVRFSWEDTTDYETGYEFFYSTKEYEEDMVFIPSTTVGETGTRYHFDIQLVSGQSAVIRVRTKWELNHSECASSSVTYYPVEAKPVEKLRYVRDEDGIVLTWWALSAVEKYVIHFIEDGVERLYETTSDIFAIPVDYSKESEIEFYVVVHFVGGSVSDKSAIIRYKANYLSHEMETMIYAVCEEKYELHQVIVGKNVEPFFVNTTIWTEVEDKYTVNATIIQKFVNQYYQLVQEVWGKGLRTENKIEMLVYTKDLLMSENKVSTVIQAVCRDEYVNEMMIMAKLKDSYAINMEIDKPIIATMGVILLPIFIKSMENSFNCWKPLKLTKLQHR